MFIISLWQSAARERKLVEVKTYCRIRPANLANHSAYFVKRIHNHVHHRILRIPRPAIPESVPTSNISEPYIFFFLTPVSKSNATSTMNPPLLSLRKTTTWCVQLWISRIVWNGNSTSKFSYGYLLQLLSNFNHASLLHFSNENDHYFATIIHRESHGQGHESKSCQDRPTQDRGIPAIHTTWNE